MTDDDPFNDPEPQGPPLWLIAIPLAWLIVAALYLTLR